MDENIVAQNLEDQEETFDASEENEAAFEEDEEVFDMAANEAAQIFEQQQLDELNQFKDVEGFAAKFSEKWVLSLPEDTAKVNTIISTQLSKKARRA